MGRGKGKIFPPSLAPPTNHTRMRTRGKIRLACETTFTLRDACVRAIPTYSDSAVVYLDDLVRSWIQARDDVLDRGGATWENLKKALLELEHKGIANDI